MIIRAKYFLKLSPSSTYKKNNDRPRNLIKNEPRSRTNNLNKKVGRKKVTTSLHFFLPFSYTSAFLSCLLFIATCWCVKNELPIATTAEVSNLVARTSQKIQVF